MPYMAKYLVNQMSRFDHLVFLLLCLCSPASSVVVINREI